MSSNHKPELDGLRAISILLVIISHAGFGYVIPGGLGVTVFFFVSGYLITSLLIHERESKGGINLGRFYYRRFWRLLPPMFFFLATSCVLILVVNKHLNVVELLASLFYMANYYKIFVHYEAVGGGYSPFAILWSLAIEEHFYIVFAPVLAFTYKSGRYFKVICAFLVIPLIIRLLVVELKPEMLVEGGYNYSATETRIDSIAFGCFLACIFATQEGWSRLKALLLNRLVFFASFALLLVTLLFRSLYFRETFRYSIQNVSLLVIVANVVYERSALLLVVKRFLSTRPMVFIGKLSYSLYLQHWLASVVMSLLITQNANFLQWQVGYWIMTIALSLFSYYVIEQPTIKYRRKYGSNV